MASNTMVTWRRRQRKKSNLGRKRKNRERRHSTKSRDDLFAGMGEPGKPAPKRATNPPKSSK